MRPTSARADFYRSLSSFTPGYMRSPPTTPDRHHLGAGLANSLLGRGRHQTTTPPEPYALSRAPQPLSFRRLGLCQSTTRAVVTIQTARRKCHEDDGRHSARAVLGVGIGAIETQSMCGAVGDLRVDWCESHGLPRGAWRQARSSGSEWHAPLGPLCLLLDLFPHAWVSPQASPSPRVQRLALEL